MASLRDIGQSLKEAREAQGMALDEVANRTRITVRHLMALEEGNEADLPEVFYVRGFLKKYAEAVGLSPKDVADAYRAAPIPTTSQPTMSSSAGPVIYYVAILALIGGILYLAWYFQPKLSVVADVSPAPSVRPAAHVTPHAATAASGAAAPASGAAAVTGASGAAVPKPSGTAKPSPAVSGASPTATPAAGASSGTAASAASAAAAANPSAGPSDNPSPLPSGQITVELTIEQKAWVEVRVDGKPAFEGLLAPKTYKVYKGHAVMVSAGNAGGVHVTVNGHDRGYLGERGVVVARTYKP